MSTETLTWLNENVLVGFTEKRGNAWHYKASEQGAEPNHYTGAIPVEDVMRRLFHWQAVPRPVFVRIPTDNVYEATGIDDDGNFVVEMQLPHAAWMRSDTHTVLGVHTEDGYVGHQYDEWLVRSVATLLDDDLSIGSAGLLKGGAVAWVSVEIPDTIVTPEGVGFRPYLLATTSFDGSIATTFKRVCTFTVCDNTLAMALGERGVEHRIRHSKHSAFRLLDARDALGIVHSMADEFTAEIARLAAIPVSPALFASVLDKMMPIPSGVNVSKAAVTLAERKRAEIDALYLSDPRVAPWAGSALGVVQAFNTWTHHVAATRTERAERNMLKTIRGDWAQLDARVLSLVGAGS